MTRATLLTAPYRTNDGRWVAPVMIGSVPTHVLFNSEDQARKYERKSAVTVKRVGNEWRAG